MREPTDPIPRSPGDGSGPSPGGVAAERVPLSTSRRLVFALLTTVLFFGLIELAMAAASAPMSDGGALLVGNHLGAPYLVHSDGEAGWVRARQELTPMTFVPDAVSDRDLHVAFFGGSTMATLPPEGPAWQLGGLLDVATEGHVVLTNAGAAGFGSNRIRSLMDEVLGHSPDVVVLYTGHNEFMEARHSSQTLDVRRGGLRQLRGTLEGTGTWQLLQGILGGPPDHHKGPGSPTGPLDPGEEPLLLARFRDNLEHMGRAAKASGAAVLWILPASNLSSPPLASLPPPEPELRGPALAGEPGARAAYAASAPDVAEAWFWTGQVALARGDRGTALSALRRARDLDQDVVRAKTAHRQILAEVAANLGIRTVDAEEALLARTGERYLKGGLTFDAMHLTAEGYRIVAEIAYDALQQDVPGLPSRRSLAGSLPARGPVPIRDALCVPHGPEAPTDGLRVRHPGGQR